MKHLLRQLAITLGWRRVLLVNQPATVLRRLPFHNVQVRVDYRDGVETWWRGNLRLIFLLLLLLLLVPSVHADAQPVGVDRLTPPLPTAGERRAADIASWATILTAVVLDAKATIGKCDGQDQCYHALVFTAARVGVTYGAVFAVKKLVHRERPCAPSDCGLDNPDFSFYSAHTALAFSTLGGPRLSFALPLAIGTGGLRVAAGKHYLTDVLVGAAVGALTSRIR